MTQRLASFLPGPPAVSDDVLRALALPPLYHRSKAFAELHAQVKSCLLQLTAARDLAIMSGGGTLANDLVAAHLARVEGKGLVISNGEFGARLSDHASRAGAEHDHVELASAQRIDAESLAALTLSNEHAWLWVTHCETAFGLLNDLPSIKAWAKDRGVALALDCVSSLGQCDVDLRGVALASGVSGKALGSVPGLALIFEGDADWAHRLQHQSDGATLPRSFDLASFAQAQGVPHTLPGNLLAALNAAISAGVKERAQRNAAFTSRIRASALRSGIASVIDEAHAAPSVTTLKLLDHASSFQAQAEAKGLLLASHSPYLANAGLVQCCTFGDVREPDVAALCEFIAAFAEAAISKHE